MYTIVILSTEPPLPKFTGLATEAIISGVFKPVRWRNTSLYTLTDQVQGITKDILLLRHDLQKVREHTLALEGRASELEDLMCPPY